MKNTINAKVKASLQRHILNKLKGTYMRKNTMCIVYKPMHPLAAMDRIK